MGLKKVVWGCVSVAAVGVAADLGGGWYLSQKLIFPYGLTPGEPLSKPGCTPWLNDVAYADLQGGESENSRPLEMTCALAKTLPKTEHTVQSPSLRQIHWVLFQNPVPQPAPGGEAGGEAPLMLHVHGVTGSWLGGARYYLAASRMGFQLAALDMGNHGESSNDGMGAQYGATEHMDVTAVASELVRLNPKRPLYINATSMGSMATMMAAPQLARLSLADGSPAVKALFLDSAIPSVRSIGLRSPAAPRVPEFLVSTGIWIVKWRRGVDLDTPTPAQSLAQARIPTFLIHSAGDQTVPLSFHDEIEAAFPKEVTFGRAQFAKGRHSAVWNGQPKAYEAEMRDFWERVVSQGRLAGKGSAPEAK